MFSVFLTDRPARCATSTTPSAPTSAAYAAFFHAMLDRGVYLPPSAYEAWFVSAAHDDRAVQTVLDALPDAARAAAAAQEAPDDASMSQTPDTVVHLLRHGEVHNPEGVLYGRRDGYHLSDLGRQMADRVADALADRDITHVRSSPLERAQETAAPMAAAHGLEIVTDERVIESTNVFEGKRFGDGDNALLRAVGLAPPLEPVEAVVGRALQGGRGPDDVRRPRRPRRGRPATRR